MTRHDVTDTEYARALAAGQRAGDAEFRARAVRYVPDYDAIEIVTAKSGGFLIPRGLVEALKDVAPEHLTKLALWPDGSLIEIKELDIHISVHGVVTAALPFLVPRRVMARVFAARGGSATSKAKATSSKENGKRGGRPRKASPRKAA